MNITKIDRSFVLERGLRGLALLGAFVCASGLFWPADSHAAGKKFYVMKTGNDGNPGSLSSPFLTVRRGIDSTRAGDTLFIGPGEYDEAYGSNISWCDYSWDAGTLFMRYGGTSESNRLVVRSMHGSARPVICGHRGYYNRYAACAYQKNFITLDSLIVKQAVRGIYMEGCDNITIQNVVVCSTFIGDQGAHVDNNAGILINYCESGDNVIIRACSLYTNWGRTGTYPSYTFVHEFNQDGIISYRFRNGRITNNVIWDESGGIRLKSGIGYGMQVDSNRIFDCDFGIFGYGLDRAHIFGNVIYNVGEGITPQCRGNANDSSVVGVVIRNNTIYGNGGSGIKFEWADSPVAGQFRACSVYNNIVVANNGANREWAILQIELADSLAGKTGVANLYENHNDWYDSGNTQPIRWVTSAGQQNWTVSQYQAATVHGDNSMQVNPLFVNPAAFDFRLGPSSPLIGQGAGGTDMGAYGTGGGPAPDSTAPSTITDVR